MGYQDWKLAFLHWAGVKRWAVILHECDDSIHVLPIADDIVHELEECTCGPDAELVANGHWMYKHHSLDGREFNEKGAETT